MEITRRCSVYEVSICIEAGLFNSETTLIL